MDFRLIRVGNYAEERRVLSGKKFLPGARLKPKWLGVGLGVEKVS